MLACGVVFLLLLCGPSLVPSLPPSIIHVWTFMNDYSSSKDQCPSACRQMALIFWVYGSPFFTWMALEANMSLSLGLAGAVLPAASGGCCCCCCWTLLSEGMTSHSRRQTIINVLTGMLGSPVGILQLMLNTLISHTHTLQIAHTKAHTHTHAHRNNHYRQHTHTQIS